MDVIENEKNGLLVPPADSSALAEAIKKLLSNHAMAERLAQSGYSTIKNHYSLDSIVKRYLELYRGLLK